MRPGYFFEPIEGTLTKGSNAIFRYLEVGSEEGYPIYVTIEQEKIFFGLSLPGEFEHSEIFHLYLSDYENDSGKLSSQLIKMAELVQYHRVDMVSDQQTLAQSKRLGDQSGSVISYASVFDFTTHQEASPLTELIVEPAKSLWETIGWKQENQSKQIGDKVETGICLRTLFLDFLFDLKHSDVFSHSRHFDRLMLISRENYMLSSIINLLETRYWTAVQQARANENQSEEIGNSVSAYLKNKRIQSAKAWIKTLTDTRSTSILAGTAWLTKKLEDELFDTLQSEMEVLPTKNAQKREEPMWEEITEWSVSRLSYIRIVSFMLPLRWAHIGLFVLPWIVLGVLVSICPDFKGGVECENGSISPCFTLTRKILLFISLFISLGAWIFALKNKLYRQAEGNLFKSILYLTSPRLLISGLIGWTIVSKLYILEAVPNLEICSFSYGALLLACLVIPLIYLSRELATIAKDLPAGRIIKRSAVAIGVLIILTLIVGLALDFFINIASGDPVDPANIILKTPFVFFSTIFLNFLFAGKRFTGM